MGKNRTDFVRNKIPEVEVEVANAGGMKLEARKLETKKYYRYSGYPGGLTAEAITKTIEKKGVREVLRKAVYGMLPKNKLRPRMMKNLKIYE